VQLRPSESSLEAQRSLPLVDLAQRSRWPARLLESEGGHQSPGRAAAAGPERSADAQGSRGANAGPPRALHARSAERTQPHAAGWRSGLRVRIIRSGSRFSTPPDISIAIEFHFRIMPIKKTTIPKTYFPLSGCCGNVNLNEIIDA